MPKVLDQPRERILCAAAESIRDATVNIRAVAERCGLSVGTVYRYFPSKEALMAQVMLESWKSGLEEMQRAAQAEEPLCALEAMHRIIHAFIRRYTPFFERARGPIAPPSLHAYHRQLIDGMASPVALAIREETGDPELPRILAELLLLYGHDPDGFERLRPSFQKLLSFPGKGKEIEEG